MAFCLAAALFDFPAAPGFVAPDTGVPQAWMLRFKRNYATRGVYRGVFSSCKAGRVWVLDVAPKARLTLDVGEPQEPDAFLARLAGARDALILRGPAPTHLQIERGDVGAQCDAQCAAVGIMFEGVDAVITHVEMIDYHQDAPCAAYTELLLQRGPLLPHLTSMKLEPAFPLPPPSSLRQLTTLHLSLLPASSHKRQSTIDNCFSSCAFLLPQLIELTVEAVVGYGGGNLRPQWDLLLNPASTTNTLTTFSTDEWLRDELLELLLEHAPALQSLAVYQLDLDCDFSDNVWGVTALHLTKDLACVDSSDLQWLPKCSSGVVMVTMHHPLDFTVDSTEGISAGFCERLSEWKIDTYAVHLQPDENLPVADQAAALRAALAQLCAGLQVVRRRDYWEDRRTPINWDEWPPIGAEPHKWAMPHGEWQPHTPRLDLTQWPASPDIIRACDPFLHAFAEAELPKPASVVEPRTQAFHVSQQPARVRVDSQPIASQPPARVDSQPVASQSESTASPGTRVPHTCAPHTDTHAIPELPKLEQLTDELLSAALDAAPHRRTLEAAALALQSDQHASVALPWAKLSVITLNVTQLLRLPHPGVGGADGAGAAGAGADGAGNPGGAGAGADGLTDTGGMGTGMQGGGQVVSASTVGVTQLLRLPRPVAGGSGVACGAGGAASAGDAGAGVDGGGGAGHAGGGVSTEALDGERVCIGVGGKGTKGTAGAEGVGSDGVRDKVTPDGGTEHLRMLACAHITIPEAMTKVQAEALRSRLRHIEWEVLQVGAFRADELRITLQCPADSAMQLPTLELQSTLLHAMRFASGYAAPCVVIDLTGWPMREDIMHALAGLPHWPVWLDFRKCLWPLQHTEYRSLAQHVPVSYSVWWLPGQPHFALVRSIVAGLAEGGVRQSKMALVFLEYTGAPLKRGEHVLMVKGECMRALSTCGVERCWAEPTLLS